MTSNTYQFHKPFEGLLKGKRSQNTVSGRFDLEKVPFNKRVQWVIDFIESFGTIQECSIRIQFWEKNEKIEAFFQDIFPNKSIQICTKYKNGKRPGIVFLQEEALDSPFLTVILENHFNFEMAKDPSLNIRVQLQLIYANRIIGLDIYDDRGFHYFWLKN